MLFSHEIFIEGTSIIKKFKWVIEFKVYIKRLFVKLQLNSQLPEMSWRVATHPPHHSTFLNYKIM